MAWGPAPARDAKPPAPLLPPSPGQTSKLRDPSLPLPAGSGPRWVVSVTSSSWRSGGSPPALCPTCRQHRGSPACQAHLSGSLQGAVLWAACARAALGCPGLGPASPHEHRHCRAAPWFPENSRGQSRGLFLGWGTRRSPHPLPSVSGSGAWSHCPPGERSFLPVSPRDGGHSGLRMGLPGSWGPLSGKMGADDSWPGSRWGSHTGLHPYTQSLKEQIPAPALPQPPDTWQQGRLPLPRCQCSD